MNSALLWRGIAARLLRFKAKTLAMGLGLALGVLSTVLLTTLAGEVMERFRVFLEAMYPADGIVLYPGSGPMGGGAGRRSLKLADVEAIVAETGISAWDPLVYAGQRDVRAGAVTGRVSLLGVSEQAEQVRRRPVEAGGYFTLADVRSRARVALIGSTAAARLFPGASPIGGEVFVDNVAFEVLGVLERRGADPHGSDQDDVLWVPYTTLLDQIVRSTSISGVMFRIADPGRVESVADEVAGVVRRAHAIAPGQADDFSVFTSARMQTFFRRSFGTVEIFVPLISATLYLISALVILAIVQIGLKARRAEIGLRKALGARARDIETQIVLEVLVVAVAATLVGWALAEVGRMALLPMLAKKFGVASVTTSPGVVLLAAAAALVAGLLGALLPARRAARLDPVATLR